MRINEVLTNPYKLKWNNNVSWGGGRPSRKEQGVSGEFTTDNDIEYDIIGMYLGKTQEEKDNYRAAKKAEDDAEKPKRGFSIRIPAINRTGGMWEVHFNSRRPDADRDAEHRGWKNELTSEGNEFRVFATVLLFIKQLAERNNPAIISIKSSNTEKGRDTLYKRLADRYAGSIGYTVHSTKVIGDQTRIELRRLPSTDQT
jgi:hypothetical protein